MTELVQFIFRMVTGGIYILLELALPKWQALLEERRQQLNPADWGRYEDAGNSLPRLKDGV